jgi:hypothetical protein
MMRKLTSGILAVGLLLAIGFTSANAQDVTDNDIKNFAIIELAKKSITSVISPLVNDMIEKQEGMTGQRFQELQKTKGDKAKMTAIEALDWEIQFYELVNKQIDKKKKAATDVVKLLASNAMGASAYKATKAAIAADPDMKAKFDGYVAAVQ